MYKMLPFLGYSIFVRLHPCKTIIVWKIISNNCTNKRPNTKSVDAKWRRLYGVRGARPPLLQMAGHGEAP